MTQEREVQHTDEQRRPGGGAVTRRRALTLGAGTLAGLGALGGQAHAHAATAPPPPSRDTSFDEDWRFMLGDPAGAESPIFDDGDWRLLDLPHDWSIEDRAPASENAAAVTSDPSCLVDITPPPPDPNTPQQIGPFDTQASAGQRFTGWTVGGVAWYRKTFTTKQLLGARTSDPDAHAELRFDGVYQNAEVWINGTKLGFHPFGYTPFAFDLTPHLRAEGKNVVAVRVDNSGKTSRWYSGSGIYRHTWTTVTGSLRVPLFGVAVTTPQITASRAQVHVSASVANLGGQRSEAGVRVTVRDPRGRLVAHERLAAADIDGGASTTFNLTLPVANPQLWSPEAPNLYTATVEVLSASASVDIVQETFGIRSLTWNGTVGFQLNGKSIKLAGGCVHDTFGPLGAVGVRRSMERRVELLKEAGFNAIRTAHNPPTPALLDVCDRMGMLVWDEFTDCWDEGKNPQDYSVYFADWWQRDLTTMIKRDRNHPSIIIWSLGNEIPEYSGYAQRGAEMSALVRKLDPTRPISLGSSGGPGDASNNWIDVGDYHYATGDPSNYHATGKPVTQSENFANSLYDDWQFTLAHDWYVGSFLWTAMDYLGESGIGKTPIVPAGTSISNTWDDYVKYGGYTYPYPWFQSDDSDLDLIGQRTGQNLLRRAVQNMSPVEMTVQRPTPPGTEQGVVWWDYYDEQESWTWDVDAGQPMVVAVYTPGDSVRLEFNDAPIDGVGPATPIKARATFTVPYAPGRLTAIASQAGKEIGRRTLVTAGAPAAVRLTSDVQRMTTDPDDLAHVLVEIVDAQGTVVGDAVIDVHFSVQGAGALAGVANANPHNVDSFHAPRRFTWNGRAQAILRPTTTGNVTLTASAAGLTPATITVPVNHAPTAGASQLAGVSRRSSLRSTAASAHRLMPASAAVLGVIAVIGRRVSLQRDDREGS